MYENFVITFQLPKSLKTTGMKLKFAKLQCLAKKLSKIFVRNFLKNFCNLEAINYLFCL